VGSQLPQLAKALTLLAVMAIATPAHADEVADLMAAGSQAYQDGRYDEAIAKMTRAYELSPTPEILFALAQAERLGGRCPEAVAHYKKVLEKVSDLETSRLVQGNIALCERTQAIEPSKPPPVDKPRPADPAPMQVQTVVRVERRTDPLAVGAFALGALGLGTSIGLFIASGSTRDAAANAPTLDDNRSLNDRADSQRTFAFVAGGAGLALVGFGIFRLVTAGAETPPPATVAVSRDGSATTLSVFARW
jgi:tetratricopeptide (TPR) repeat protein